MPEPVAITGLGSVTPLAVGARETHAAWMAGTCAIEDGFGRCKDFVAEDRIDPRARRRADRFVQLSIVAGEEAIADAGWEDGLPYEPERIACVIATAIAGQQTYAQEYDRFKDRGAGAVNPLRVLLAQPNGAAVWLAMRHGMRGEMYGLSGACAGGLQAIGAAVRMIRAGAADAALVGGVDAEFTGLGHATYGGLGAVSPSGICRPFDRRRDGMVPGEGAALMVIENLEKARARGARILAEIIGYAAGSDAHHLTSPHAPGQARTIERALEDARIAPSEITYVNAHGTGTELNDVTETTAIKTALGDDAYRVQISSLKSAIGHLQGAAGAVEAVETVLALRDGVAPPTLQLEEQDERLDLDYVPLHAQRLDGAEEGSVVTGLTNSFGLGGHNACLVMRARVETGGIKEKPEGGKMAITAKIPTALRPLTENRREVPVAGATVGEALGSLFDEYGELRERIWADGSLRRFVNVYVHGEDIRALDGLDTPLREDDELTILPAVAGGS